MGETGGGKTSVCQAVSDFLSQTLFTVNCHLNTDASDFLGSLRPCRDEDTGQLFEWANGPMVDAMEQGQLSKSSFLFLSVCSATR